MKRLSGSMLAVLLAAMPIIASSAGGDKSLTNLKGSVTYGPSATPTTAVAPHSQVTLNDADYAATGGDSQARISLPDSTTLLMGSSSSVRMDAFDNSGAIVHAKFYVVGKVRFLVQHPSGAQADYTFQTSTGQIAVRGTEGDVFQSPTGGLQVNVYAVSNPALPVQVTLVNGQVFTLAAGQSLVATAVAGAVTAAVGGITQSSLTTFSELGPANAGTAGAAGSAGAGAGAAGSSGAAGAAGGAAGGAASATAAAVAAGTAAAVTVATSNTTATSAPTATPTIAPTATPTPVPSTTSVPITINGKPGSVNPRGPGDVNPRVPGARPTPPTQP